MDGIPPALTLATRGPSPPRLPDGTAGIRMRMQVGNSSTPSSNPAIWSAGTGNFYNPLLRSDWGNNDQLLTNAKSHCARRNPIPVVPRVLLEQRPREHARLALRRGQDEGT